LFIDTMCAVAAVLLYVFVWRATIRRRLTIAQIRTHPWVTAGGYSSAAAMDEDPEPPALSFDDLPPMEPDRADSAEASFLSGVASYDDDEFLHDEVAEFQ
jgi:hypothetical protein